MTDLHPTLRVCRQLAQDHPGALLPCPLCAAAVKGANLVRHLDQKHAAETPPSPDGRRFRAWDRRGPLELSLALAALVAVAVALVVAGRVVLPDPPPPALLVAGVVGVLAWLGLLVAPLPARLTVDAEGVRLRFALGLRVRALGPITRIEVGRARARRDEPGTQSYEHPAVVEVDDGVYLRLSDGRRHLTLGCRQGTRFRQHWSPEGWRSAPSTRWLDARLTRSDMVALEYRLAALDRLRVRLPRAEGQGAQGQGG